MEPEPKMIADVETPVTTEVTPYDSVLNDQLDSSKSIPNTDEASISSVPAAKWIRDHPIEQIIGDKDIGVQRRSQATSNFCMFVNIVSVIKPKKVDEALGDAS